MAISRRGLLGLGAACAVSAATGCRAGGTAASLPDAHVSVTPPPPTPSPTASASPIPGPGFPGQPPPGYVYYGASVPHHRSLPDWEQELGAKLGLNRSYFTPDLNETAQLVHRCRDDLAHGRLPHVSIKSPGTWSEVAAGARDEWLTGMLRPLGEGSGPVFLTLHHEPENDAGPPGMQPSDFVAMQDRAIRIARDLAPEVTIVPVLQQWTFDPARHDVDPAAWLVPEASVIGLDVYNPWSPTNGKQWRSFGNKVDEVLSWFGSTPLAIGEYGCRDDPQVPGLAAEWLRDAAEYARTHQIVSMSYFNSGIGSDDGTWELEGQTERAFARLLTEDWVFRPA